MANTYWSAAITGVAWASPLNRDASLIFENNKLAGYFADAFQIDWERADRIRPRQFVRKPKDEESAVLLVADTEAPERPGYRRMRLSDYLAMIDD